MSSITSTNIDDTILSDLQAALKNATIDGDRVFEEVKTFGSRDEVNEKEFVASPIAGLVYVATDTYEIPDLNVGCVLRATVMIAVKEDTPPLRSRELTKYVNAARNTLHTSVPASANGFPEPEGDYHPRIKIDTPERDDEAEDPWAIAWLSVEVAYRVDTTVSH